MPDKAIAMGKFALAFSTFLLTIPSANWLVGNVGATCIPEGPCLVPVWPGVDAPSGVLMVGVALVARDWLQEVAGSRAVLMAVALGCCLSVAVAPPALALASVAAFALANMFDWAAYTALRGYGRAIAVGASQVAGAALDSLVFLSIAFSSTDYFVGNTIGKIYAGIAVAAALYFRRL